MKKTLPWIVAVAMIACAPAAQETEQAVEPEALEATAAVADSYPDPDAETAQEVEVFVSEWVAERAGDDGTYAIPPRAGHEVSGTMADFHTVHQKDADTYSVCVDFKSDERLYDVDFFVDRAEGGLVIADHYLHKIDGAPLE